jgi:hypothetical protein
MTFEELRVGAEKNQGAKRVGDEDRSTCAQALLAECTVRVDGTFLLNDI